MKNQKVNVKDINKEELLLALYKASHQQGNSFLGYPGREPTLDDCRKMLECSNYVDYFFGKNNKM